MKKLALLQVFCWLCTFVLHGQANSFFWNNDIIPLTPDKNNYQTSVYGTQNGLPSSEIISLAQDRKGYLWVGTSVGLSRYDGINFINFLKADNRFMGKIYKIREDTLRKKIWVACEAGLCYFAQGKLHFVPFKERDVSVYDIHLKDSSMWLATGKGPVHFPGKIIVDLGLNPDLSLAAFLFPQWKSAADGNPEVYNICSSETGNLYFAGKRNVFLYDNKSIRKIWASHPRQSNTEYVVGIVQGKKDSVFFASAFEGLYFIQNEKVTKLLDDGYIAAELSKQGDRIYYLTANGIYQFHPSTFKLKKISVVPENLNIWASCLLADNEDNLWIGMHENLLYQKPRIFFEYREEEEGAIPELYSVIQLKNNELLFGANRGKVYRKRNATFENIFGTKQAVPHAEIKSIFEDSRGWLWLGTGYEGIALVRDQKIINFTKADGLSNNSNYFFYEDTGGNIYTGGDGGFSKIRIDAKANHFQFQNFYYLVAGDNSETFKNCIAGPDGTLWLAGREGVFYFKKDSLFTYPINGDTKINVTDIRRDKSGNAWLSTKGEGIWQCFFDPNNLLKVNKIFSLNEGLQSDIYLSLTIDNEDNLWACSYAGITSIKKEAGKYNVVNYTSNDAFLTSNYQAIQIYCDNNDTVWVASSTGLTSFYAGIIKPVKKLVLNFTGIALADTSMHFDWYKKRVSIPGFPHSLKGIEFQFKAICLSDPKGVLYSYRLSGLGSAWSDWNNKETVTYQNLPPGSYSFEVKASLDNTVTPVISFSFVIEKPFWQTWWFIILCAVAAGYFVYFLQKDLKKDLQKKNDEKIKTQQLISENLQYQLEVEQVANYFTRFMSSSQSVDELLWDVTKNCISKLGFEDCVIYMKDPSGKLLLQKSAWGPKDMGDKILSPIEIPVGKGIVGSVAVTGIAEIVNDVTKDPRYITDDETRLSEITVPVIYENEVLGIIDSESTHKNFYTQWHLQILTSIASHCAERIVKLEADKILHHNEMELLQSRNKLAEEKLTALRSRMNPHFIFNSLNSIQQFILKGDAGNANKYLSQFSRLIRLVLQNSEYNFIRLEEEINMLELYLSLEKTRFGDSFEYSITVAEGIDAEELKIPNLIILPFVENAIWHGLMHKLGERKIRIHFQIKNEETVICEITDNGIGRERAAELKAAKPLNMDHKSIGMQLVKDKIEVLKQQYKGEVSIQLNDIMNDEKQVCGTRVLIQIPLEYQ